MGGTTREKKPFEAVLTILVALAATLAAFAGYMASVRTAESNGLQAQAFRFLNVANALLIQADQVILRDEFLLIRADDADRDGNHTQAVELRRRTVAYREGFLDENGNATAAYGGNFTLATEEYLKERYRPHVENRTASEALFARAEVAGARGLDFLFATVLFALAALLGVSGLSVTPLLSREILVFIVSGMIVVSTGFVFYTALL